MLMERRRGCGFLLSWLRVIELQIRHFTDGYNTLENNKQIWEELARTRDQLSEEDLLFIKNFSKLSETQTLMSLEQANALFNAQNSQTNFLDSNYSFRTSTTDLNTFNSSPTPPAPFSGGYQSPPPPPSLPLSSIPSNIPPPPILSPTLNSSSFPPPPPSNAAPSFAPPFSPPPPTPHFAAPPVAPPPFGSYSTPRALEKCQVLFAYQKQREDEMDIYEGEIVTILEKQDDGWYKGRIGNREGLFPANFCTIIG